MGSHVYLRVVPASAGDQPPYLADEEVDVCSAQTGIVTPAVTVEVT